MEIEEYMNMLSPGEDAVVKSVSDETGMKRRLTDLGLTENTRVQCQLVAAGGDPAAYRIRGALVALRSTDAHCVRIVRA